MENDCLCTCLGRYEENVWVVRLVDFNCVIHGDAQQKQAS